MKNLHWEKLNVSQVSNKNNLWSAIIKNDLSRNLTKEGPKDIVKFTEMEKLFFNSFGDTLQRGKKKKDCLARFFDGKTSLNIDIFLTRFKQTKEEQYPRIIQKITKMIEDGNHKLFGEEKLQALEKLLKQTLYQGEGEQLTERDEIVKLKSFQGKLIFCITPLFDLFDRLLC